MGIPCVIWLSLFSSGVFALNYYLEGQSYSVSFEDATDLSPDEFVALENKIRHEFEAALGKNFNEFFVEKFEVHGESGPQPTTIFLAYFDNTLERNEILQKIEVAPSLRVFYLSQIDELPQRSQVVKFSDDVAVDSCTNGGILLPNSTCACQPFYTGDRCEIIQCLHQGIVDKGQCFCPPGVYSMNCEPRSCLPPVQNTFDISQKTFMLVVNTKTSQAYALNYLFTNIGSVLDQMNSNSSTAYYNYILTTYVAGDNFEYMKTSYFVTSTDLVNYLLGVVHITDGAALQPTNRAILQTQSSSGKMRGFSNIFVFTDALDSEAQDNTFMLSANTSENNLILKTIAWRNKIVYLLGQAMQAPMELGDRYASYQRVVQSTQGDIIPYNMQNVMEVAQVIRTFIPIYQNVEVTAAWYSNPANVSAPLFSDYSGQTLWILVTADPSGNLPKVAVAGSDTVYLGWKFMLLSVQSTSNLSINTSGSPVSTKVFVNSLQTILISFMYNMAFDVGDTFASKDMTEQATAALISFNGQNIELVWEEISSRSMLSFFTFSMIGECAFPYAALGSFMSTPGPFLQFASIDDQYHRIVPGYFVIQDKHNPPPFVCLNGGSNTSPNSCQCPQNLKGDHCEIPICLYGGVVNPFPGNGLGLCNCPAGYSGDFCENMYCSNPSLDSFDNTARSFGMVMQTSMSQSQGASSINQGLGVMLNMLTGNDSFKEYLLTTFNSPIQGGTSSPVYSTSVYSAPDDFKQAVSNVSYLATKETTFDSFSALFSAMMRATKDRSSFFLFVDALPSGTLQEMDIAWYAITHQHEISIIITAPYNMPELCIPAMDIGPYLTIVQMTGGVIYNLCSSYTPNGLDPIVEFFRGFGVSHHHTENIAEYLSPSCRAMTTLSFFVDDPKDDVFLIVNSQSTQNFTVAFSNNDNPGSYPLAPISNTPFLSVYSIPLNALNTKGYQLNVNDGAYTVYGGCFSRIVSKTTVAVYMSFSADPSEDAQTRTLSYATETFPVVHVSTPIDGPVSMTALDNNGDLHYYSPDTKRNSSCRYESYFRFPLICDSPYGTFIMEVRTSPPSGGIIQRSRRTMCYIGQQTCLNGGTLLDNGKCYCPPGKYQGNYCEYPICQNGAELNEYQCICGGTRAGKFCEYETCNSLNFMESADPRETDYKQITFVLNTNIDQLLTATFISSWIQQYVNDVQTGTPKLYTLIIFDDQSVTDVATTSDKDVFVEIVQKTIVSTPRRSATSSRSLDAINEAFKTNIDPPSIIYLFTGNDASRTSILNSLIRQRIGTQVNIIYTPQNQQYPGQPGGTYGAYLSVAARQSGGRIWPLTQNSLIALEPPLSKTVLENALVFDDAQPDCSQGTTFSFIMDKLYSTAYFDISGRDITVVITNSSGDRVSVTFANILLSDSALLLLSFDSASNSGGSWNATVTTSSGSCYLQVRTVSPVRVVPGFTSDQNNDFVKELPFLQYGSNKTAYMTFRLIDNQQKTDSVSILNRVDISSGDFDRPWSGRQALQSLKIRRRAQDGCASQYVSDPWKLDKSSFQKFVVYGSDSNGGQFQRTFFYSFSTGDQTSTCFSGGTRNANGECICDAQHSGDYCMGSVCQNGGSSSYGVCVCPNGYYGYYCEQYMTYGNNTTVGPTMRTTTSSIGGSTTLSTIRPTTTIGTTLLSTISSSRAGTTTTSATSTAAAQTTTNSLGSSTVAMSSTAGTSTMPTTSISGSSTILTVATVTTQTTPVISTITGSTPAVPTTGASVGQTTGVSTIGTSSLPPLTTTPGASTAMAATTLLTTRVTTKPTTTTPFTGSTSPTPTPMCDPFTTRYMVSLFLDATNILPDPASGIYAQREQPIVQLLAQKLDLGKGLGGSRFVFNGITSNYTYCGNVTDQAYIATQANCLGDDVDNIYDLEKALAGYLTQNYWQLGAGESPAIAVIFSATQILNGTAGSKYYIDQLQQKGYTFLGIDVSTDGSLMASLTTLVGAQNVYRADGADSTSSWLRNRICQIKPF